MGDRKRDPTLCLSSSILLGSATIALGPGGHLSDELLAIWWPAFAFFLLTHYPGLAGRFGPFFGRRGPGRDKPEPDRGDRGRPGGEPGGSSGPVL